MIFSTLQKYTQNAYLLDSLFLRLVVMAPKVVSDASRLELYFDLIFVYFMMLLDGFFSS